MIRTPDDERLVSLDAFRGFTIASMVLVNNPGNWSHVHAPLGHAPWDGWTFTDTVFPFFLFICGVSMAFSLGRRAAAGVGNLTLVGQSLRRGATIIGIGLLLNLVPAFDLATVRIPGVLQRIGLCVMLAAPIAAWFTWRQQCAWIAGLLAAYAYVMFFVPVPDASGRIAAGVLQPGQDAGAWLDRFVMGGHLWAKSRTWDPEGLLSTLPALCSLLFGLLAGQWLLAGGLPAERTVWMAMAGLAGVFAGSMLDLALMPINKSLWSVSYCVFMAGWALLAFSAFHWFVDACDAPRLRARARRLLAPFTIYGMNALFLFAFSGLVTKLLGAVRITLADGREVVLKAALYAPFEALPVSPANASLAFAVAFNLAMFCMAWALWKRRWFLRV